MKLIKKSILLLALAGGTFLSGGKAYAQQTLVDVRVDSAAILIGEQTVLHLTVTADKDKAVQLVIPRDTLMAGVEVLEISKADSTLIENDRLLIGLDQSFIETEKLVSGDRKSTRLNSSHSH